LPKNFGKHYCSIFVCIWQILSNHGVTRIIRFVSQITDKLCNQFLFLFIFNAPCMGCKIRCDGESWKFLALFGTKQGLREYDAPFFLAQDAWPFLAQDAWPFFSWIFFHGITMRPLYIVLYIVESFLKQTLYCIYINVKFISTVASSVRTVCFAECSFAKIVALIRQAHSQIGTSISHCPCPFRLA